MLYAFGITVIMLIGMMGRQSSEGAREWWSRLGAWLGIYGVAWMIVAVAAVYGPQWVALGRPRPPVDVDVGGRRLGRHRARRPVRRTIGFDGHRHRTLAEPQEPQHRHWK